MWCTVTLRAINQRRCHTTNSLSAFVRIHTERWPPTGWLGDATEVAGRDMPTGDKGQAPRNLTVPPSWSPVLFVANCVTADEPRRCPTPPLPRRLRQTAEGAALPMVQGQIAGQITRTAAEILLPGVPPACLRETQVESNDRGRGGYAGFRTVKTACYRPCRGLVCAFRWIVNTDSV
jgi:hypothetical protein